MKIYYQYSYIKKLTPTGGDLINEIGICTALSKFAEVYYSGQLFNPEKKDYGLKDYKGEIKITDADIYIIRANEEVFNKVKGIRIWISSPFNKPIFEKTDYIGTFTEAWTKALQEGRKIEGLNDGTKWNNVITLHQTLNPKFKPLQVKKDGFTIGIFGRIVESNYPYLLFSTISKIKKLPGIKFIFGISKLKIVLPNDIKVKKFTYENMPQTINSCDVIIVNQHGPEWDVCGSLKTLEAMACGIPVILERSDAREEMFGKNYPLFLDRGAMEQNSGKENQLFEKIEMLYKNKDLQQRIAKEVYDRAQFYSLDNSSKRLKKILYEIHSNHIGSQAAVY